MKESKSFPARKGQKLQLLFIKPSAKSGPEVRSLPSARSYLEACIYEMDLKVGKKYNLFLAAQKGRLMGKALMARYVMTGPPLLASNKTRKRIEAATCPTCGKLDFLSKYIMLYLICLYASIHKVGFLVVEQLIELSSKYCYQYSYT